MDKNSYALGMSIAHNMMHSGVKDLNFDDFSAAVRAVMSGDEPEIPFEEAGQILEKYFAVLEAEKAAASEEIGEAMKKMGEEFLAENKNQAGVVTLPSGLQYKIIKDGSGRKPGINDKVKCHYEGRFPDGNIFDSSYKRGEPAVFGVTQVIKGWTEALQLMSEGSKWELYLPYNLAYGENGAGGSIPPYATLVFTVELLSIE